MYALIQGVMFISLASSQALLQGGLSLFLLLLVYTITTLQFGHPHLNSLPRF